MKYRTPKLVIYDQNYHQAIDIICRRKLLNCEPESQPVQGLLHYFGRHEEPGEPCRRLL